MKKLFIFSFLLLTIGLGFAQQIYISPIQRNVHFRVNQLQDFIERFNKVNNSFFLDYIDANWSDEMTTLRRPELIASLFYQKDNNGLTPKQEQFIEDVTKANQTMSFNQQGWYVKVNCAFAYQRKKRNLDLVMEYAYDSIYHGYKWEIIAIEHLDFLKKKSKAKMKTDENVQFISPVSHDIQFIDLKRYFSDKENAIHYFKQPLGEREKRFVYLLQKNRLKFKQVNTMRYHFLQIDDWAFTVDYIKTNKVNKKNTGWLITQLLKLNQDEKVDYKKEKLYLDQ